MRTRPPRAGTIVADIVDYLSSKDRASIAAIYAEVNARRERRRLPQVSEASIRGALNANGEGKGHDTFRRERRGLYSLSRRS